MANSSQSLKLMVLSLCILAVLSSPTGVLGGFCDGGILGINFLPGDFFYGWSCDDILNSMGTKLIDPTDPERKPDPTIQIPEAFNSRTDHPKECATPIRNQGKCGSCWAFSGAGVLADRFCIIGKDIGALVLSPQDTINCDTGCSGSNCQAGCDGGYISLLWKYLKDTGSASDSCVPYKASQDTCSAVCESPSKNYSKFLAFDSYSLKTVPNIQRDIVKYGPVQAAITVYSDLLDYSGGIYTKQSNDVVGGHAIKIIGWGTEGGVDYWIVENSWGSGWGENGLFRIRRGTNEVGIEGSVVAGRPKIDGVNYNDDDGNLGSGSTILIAGYYSTILSLLFSLWMLF